jgi:hypothetical protein
MRSLKSLLSKKPKAVSDSSAHQTATPPNSGPLPIHPFLMDAHDKDPRISAALRELTTSVSMFTKHYGDFAKKNRLYLVQTEVDAALNKVKDERDFKQSALIFGNEITSVLEVTAKKQKLSHAKWTGTLGSYLIALYPIAKLSLNIAGAAAQVCANMTWLIVGCQLCAAFCHSGRTRRYLAGLNSLANLTLGSRKGSWARRRV